ncbi:hypothetical protein HN827_05330 [archaeon]|jgi:hypothetical protein|nr:hypothetical protein [archaeon]MBT7392226.1 hypothetical protein [archaeon]
MKPHIYRILREEARCNKCGQVSIIGDWKWKLWFCETCLEHTNVSKYDDLGTIKTRSNTTTHKRKCNVRL